MILEQALISIARQCYREPREGAVALLSLGVPKAAIWPAFGAIVLISVVMGGLGDILLPPPPGLSVSYFAMAAVLSVVFLSFAAATWRIGTAMGGKGKFEEALILGVFFQAVLLPAQILQILLAAALPGIAGFYAIALIVYGIWINVNFIDALHGFASFGKSLGVLVLASFAAAIALMVTIAILGQSMGGAF